MKNAIWNFCQVDIIRSKQQTRLIWLFVGLAMFLGGVQPERAYFAAAYLMFGAIIFSTTPFCLAMRQECGFLNMLPGTLRDRVAGRFLYTTLFVFAAGVCSVLITTVISLVFHKGGLMPWEYFVTILGVALCMCSLQNVVLYFAGYKRNQQFITLLRMVPGLLFFFASLTFMDAMGENAGKIIQWIASHVQWIALTVLAAGCALTMLGILISEKILTRRDYA